MIDESRGGFLCVLASPREIGSGTFRPPLKICANRRNLWLKERWSEPVRPPSSVVCSPCLRGEELVAGSRLERTKPIRLGIGSQGSGIRPTPRTPGGVRRTALLRQTNPIWGQAEGRISAVWATSCAERDAGEGVKKQSQFPGHGRDGRDTHGRDAHATKRLAASPRLRGDDIATNSDPARNEANSGGV